MAKVPESLKRLSGSFRNFVEESGNLSMFTYKIIRQFFNRPYEHAEMLKQAYYIGYKSIGLIAITGFIMGLVLTIQSRPVLADFGAEALLPGMVAVSIIREIGPVVTALLCAGKIGSGIGAELGSMKITEQIDAMEVSGTNPMNYVVTTRVLATTFMVPLLVILADTVALFGSYVAVNIKGHVSFVLFINNAFNSLGFNDLVPSLFKSVLFGFFIGVIGCYKGYYAGRGTESVGQAANSAVVASSLAIFIIDLIAVQVTNIIYG